MPLPRTVPYSRAAALPHPRAPASPSPTLLIMPRHVSVEPWSGKLHIHIMSCLSSCLACRHIALGLLAYLHLSLLVSWRSKLPVTSNQYTALSHSPHEKVMNKAEYVEYSWHPILMTVAFPGLMTLGRWSYKTEPSWGMEKSTQRTVHGLFMGLATIVALVGYLCIFMAHLPKKQFFGYNFADGKWEPETKRVVHSILGW